MARMATNVKARVDRDWIDARLNDVGMSGRALGRRLGLDSAAMHRRLTGKQALTIPEVNAISRFLGASFDETARHFGLEPAAAPTDRLPIVGTVNRKTGVVDSTRRPRRQAERPSKIPAGTVALELTTAGWLLYYAPSQRVEPEAIGRLSVVRTAQAEIVCTPRHGRERGQWDLDPLCGPGPATAGATLLSASPVLWIRT